VFSSGQQGAIFYIAQSFLKFYYKTENIPYWITMGYGAYQARIRPSDTEYNYYILGHIMVDFVVKTYGYDVTVLGLSGQDEFMTKYYQYYNTNWK
jgi:hypothetical protein